MAYRNPFARQLGVGIQMQPNQDRSIMVQQLMARALQNNGRGSRSLGESLDIAAPSIIAALLGKKDAAAQQQQQAQQRQMANQLLGNAMQTKIPLENLDGQPPDTFSVPTQGPTDPTRQALAGILAQNPQMMGQMAMQQAMPKPAMTPYEQAEIGLQQSGQAAAATNAQQNAEFKKRELEIAQQRANQEGQLKATAPPSGYRYKPDGTLEFIPGGPEDPANKITTRQSSDIEKQRTTLYNSVVNSEKQIQDLTDKGTTDTSSITQSMLPHVLTSDQYREYEAAGQRWAANILYLKSGATANKEEVQSTWKQYFPQPGDGPQVKAQKEAARLQEIESLRGQFAPTSEPYVPSKKGGATGGWSITPVP